MSQGLYLNTGQHKHKITTYQIFIPYVVFELTIAATERATIVHALDRPASVTGTLEVIQKEIGNKGRKREIINDGERGTKKGNESTLII